jgi:large subunit ribosomal protein L21
LGRAKIVPITTDQKADPGKPCWEYVRGRDRTRRNKTMFAVIKTGGRQYRVVPDDVLEIGKIAGDVGTIVQLGEVLVVGGETPVLGVPTVAGASVAAEVLDHKRGPKVIAFKKRRRKNSRRKRGYRDEITVLRITEILTDNAKPSIGPRPKREKVVAPAAEGDEEPKAAKKAPAKKAAAKPAAKKAPAKKAAKGKSDEK